MPHYRITSKPLTIADAEPDARRLLEQTKATMGFVPNMYAAMAQMPALLDSYLHSYTAFRTGAGFTPQEQELVFLVISRENTCGYCMAAHSFVADHMSKLPTEITDAIRNDTTIADPKLAALASMTRTMFHTRGRPDHDSVQEFQAAGYQERQLLGIVLGLATKTLSNYSNHLLDPTVDAVFTARHWEAPLPTSTEGSPR